MGNNSKTKGVYKGKVKLGQYLVDQGLLDREDLMKALEEQEQRQEKLGRILVEKKLASEVQIAQILAQQHRMPFERVQDFQIPADLIRLIPAQIARAHTLVPLRKNRDGLTVAIANPDLFYEVEKDVRFATQLGVQPVVAPASDIIHMLDIYYPQDRYASSDPNEDVPVSDIEVITAEEEDPDNVADIEKVAGLPPVVRFTNGIFTEGISMRASDIHLEPQKKNMVVRFRIDGVMQPVMKTDRKNHLAVVSRIKIMAGMDISIRRRPQDGKARLKFGGQFYDMRVSTLPTSYGEKVTIRILNPAMTRVKPEETGPGAKSPRTVDRGLKKAGGPPWR